MVSNTRVKFNLIYKLSILLYIISILFIIFEKYELSIIFIFFILGIWSKVPGFFISQLWKLEIFDFFVIILALYSSNIILIFLFIFFSTIVPMFLKKEGFNSFLFYFIDMIAMSILVFLIPFFFEISNENFFLTMILFTIFRYFFFFIQLYFYNREAFFRGLFYLITDIPFIVLSSVSLSFFFGNSITTKFSDGLTIDTQIFLFCSFIILLMVGLNLYLKKYKEYKQNKKYTKKEIEYKNYMKELKEEKPFTYMKIFYINLLRQILRKLFKVFKF